MNDDRVNTALRAAFLEGNTTADQIRKIPSKFWEYYEIMRLNELEERERNIVKTRLTESERERVLGMLTALKRDTLKAEVKALRERVAELEAKLQPLCHQNAYLLIRNRAQLTATKAALGKAQHAANKWADMATNGLQWMRNVKEGLCSPEKAVEALELDLRHCKDAALAASHALDNKEK